MKPFDFFFALILLVVAIVVSARWAPSEVHFMEVKANCISLTFDNPFLDELTESEKQQMYFRCVGRLL